VRILSLLACLIASLALATCAPPRQSEPALWRITDQDSEIWLFGSVHVLPPDLAWRGPHVSEAFAAAEEFVTETDTGDEAQQSFASLAARYGALPPGRTLSQLLGDSDQGRLIDAARELGLDAGALNRQRPWLAALQLSTAYAIRAGHRPEAGVEAVLGADARASGKRLWFLETPEQQIRTLADLPEQDELHFLRLTLRDLERGAGAMSAMDEAWARGDVATLEALLDAEWEAAGPTIHAALITNRNRDWAEQIERRLDGSGRVFIAVGAAHLLGDDSVIALLRARGVAVEGP